MRWWSNSTQHEIWAANWCNRCQHDHFTHRREPDYARGCKIIARLYGEEDHSAIAELFALTEEQQIHGDPTCIEYRACKCAGGGGDDDRHRPRGPRPGPGQLAMFDIAPHAKMYRDTLIDAGLIVPAVKEFA